MTTSGVVPVGREGVRHVLHSAVERVTSGPGSFVMITGEPGIGKTTLLSDAAEHARRLGVRQAWGWGWRGAELLADAIVSGLGGASPEGALKGYQRARDRAVKAMYDFTVDIAALAPPRPAELALFAALGLRQEDTDAFIAVLTGAVPMREAFPAPKLIRMLGWRGFARLAFRLGG